MIDELIRRSEARKVRIAVVGDPMTDEWVIGRSEDCQDGCKKFTPEKTVRTPGGARNAASQLGNWNCQAAWIGSDWGEPRKIRHIDQSGKILWRVDQYSQLAAHCWTVEASQLIVRKTLATLKVDGVLISDYDKGWLDEETIRWVIDFCKERGIPCVADPKRKPDVFAGAVLKCNSAYAAKFSGARMPSEFVVVTNGADVPSTFTDDRANILAEPMPKVECRNHVGAGDSFAAHLMFALAHGIDFWSACHIAHSAGRVFVQHPFARAPFPHEIRKDMTGCKRVEDAASLRKSIEGKKLVFANGCFDLLGAHHVRLLQEAKKCGDVLVVAVNTDQSVRRLKGPCRPVNSLEHRVTLLSALACVDWVMSFDEDAPLELLKTLKPDVLVKGDDPYRKTAGDNLAGEVRLIPLFPGSTTDAIEHIVKNNGAKAL